MRLELFGAIALTTLAAAACNSDEETTLGQGSTDTGGAYGAGGAQTGAGGVAIGNGGSGVAGTVTGMGGSQTGAGGNQTGAGGNQMGAGGNGAGGVGTVVCPATAPNTGDSCQGRGNCPYGNTNCFCSGRGQPAGMRVWNCNTQGGDGGFTPPGRDGGFTIPDGGFTSCTQGSDCTGGDVCCPRRFGGAGNICLPSQFCQNPVP